MLRLGDAEFELDTSARGTAFFLGESDEDDGTLEYSIDAFFQKGSFEGESVAPRLELGYARTQTKTAEELAGTSFTVERMGRRRRSERTASTSSRPSL